MFFCGFILECTGAKSFNAFPDKIYKWFLSFALNEKLNISNQLIKNQNLIFSPGVKKKKKKRAELVEFIKYSLIWSLKIFGQNFELSFKFKL